MNISVKSRNLLMQKMPTCSLHQLLPNLQSDREWSTSHVRWKLEFIWFAITSNQIVVFAYLRHMQSQIRFHNSEISYKFALRHVSMRRSHLFAKRSNSKSSESTHAREIFRANSRSRFTFFDFRRFFIQLQSANAVKNISSFICLAVDSHRSPRKLKAMKYPWRFLLRRSVDLKKSQKLFVFSNSSLVTLLVCESHYFEEVLDRVNLLCFYLPARSITHLKELSFGNFSMLLFYCLFTFSSHQPFISPHFEKAIDLKKSKVVACCCFIDL